MKSPDVSTAENAKPPPQRQRGVAAWLLAAAWALLLVMRRGAIYSSNVPGSDPLVLALGVLTLAALHDLHRSQRPIWGGFDRFCFLLSAIPGVLLVAEFLASFLPTRIPGVLANANWGLLLLFPATMLATSPLTRHRVLPAWNWFPALAGLALPLAPFLEVMTGVKWAGLASALLLSPAWIVLGFAARVPPIEPPRGKPRRKK